jgi:hypothetical protein
MTPSEPIGSGTGVDPATVTSPHLAGAKAASTIVLLAGIWFFVSPWVYGSYTAANAWNSWIVGVALFIMGCVRVMRPAYSTVLSWCNMILGIWAFFSPWIYGYTGNEGRFLNSLCVGVIVFVCSIASARLASRQVPATR